MDIMSENQIPFSTPPDSLCLLRLSAVGDVCHAVPVIRSIQRQWPSTSITWVIGRTEYTLLEGLEGVEFIIFDKKKGLDALRQLRSAIAGRCFDVLLHTATALRSSLISLCIPAKIRLGYDRERAKEMQWLFTNRKIKACEHGVAHVMESFFEFAEALGVTKRVLEWNIPISAADDKWAAQQIAKGQKTLVVSPASSITFRDWTVEGFSELTRYAIEKHGMNVILSGGPTILEKQLAEDIASGCGHPVLNLVGRTNLKQLFSLIKKASVLLSVDSGPAHMATAAGTPVIGLYAYNNPSRTGPYFSMKYVVSVYNELVHESFGREPTELLWKTRIRIPDAMKRINPTPVKAMLDKVIEENCYT